MKTGIAFSSAAHFVVLTWGLWAFGTPPPMEVRDIESISVDVVPFEELSKSMQGEKKAELSEKPAPKKTKRKKSKPKAEHVGDSSKDKKSKPTPKPAKKPVELAKAEAPPPAPKPAKQPKIDPVAELLKKQAPAPTPEVSAKVEERMPVTDKQVDDNAEVKENAEQFAALPKTLKQVPVTKPKAPQPKKAETTERKTSEKPAKPQSVASETKKRSVADEISALLNKDEAASTGAKASRKEASLGTRKKGEKLTQNEIDVLKAAIERCWSVPVGMVDADQMRVTVSFKLSPDGQIEGRPSVEAYGGQDSGTRRAFAGSARRAVQKCAPYSLPVEKYQNWAEVVVNFSASEMF